MRGALVLLDGSKRPTYTTHMVVMAIRVILTSNNGDRLDKKPAPVIVHILDKALDLAPTNFYYSVTYRTHGRYPLITSSRYGL